MWILLQQIEKLSTTTIPLKGIEQGNSGVNLVCFFTLFLKNNATLSSYFYWHQFYPGMCLASIIVQQRNHAEDKLLLGCEDGTLVCEQNRCYSNCA